MVTRIPLSCHLAGSSRRVGLIQLVSSRCQRERWKQSGCEDRSSKHKPIDLVEGSRLWGHLCSLSQTVFCLPFSEIRTGGSTAESKPRTLCDACKGLKAFLFKSISCTFALGPAWMNPTPPANLEAQCPCLVREMLNSEEGTSDLLKLQSVGSQWSSVKSSHFDSSVPFVSTGSSDFIHQ